MSFEIIAAGDDISQKRSRTADSTVDYDRVDCLELLKNVKKAYDLPDDANYDEVNNTIEMYSNVKREADRWFWTRHAVGKNEEFGDVTLTFLRIIADWDYAPEDEEKYGRESEESRVASLFDQLTVTKAKDKFTHDDRIRLFRLLWDELDILRTSDHYDETLRKENRSSMNLTGDGLDFYNIFGMISQYTDVETRGEEILFQKIRGFDAYTTWRMRTDFSLSLSKLMGLASEVEENEVEVEEPYSFCGFLMLALRHKDPRVNKIANGVLDVLREERYRPDWIRKNENFGRGMMNTVPPNIKDAKYGSKPYHLNRRFLRDYAAYRRSPQKDPEWIGGEFFEREIFFHNIKRKNWSVADMRNAFRDRHKYTTFIPYDFLIRQGVIKNDTP